MTRTRTNKRRTYTDAERAEACERNRERMSAAVRALTTSDGWRAWVRTRARFRKYSFGNCCLIALQNPDASHVAGFRAWKDLGRTVRAGEKAIRIFAPHTYKRTNADTGETESGVYFRAVPVFDISQTDGDPLPEIPHEPITGDSHAHYWAPLVAHAREIGYAVGRADTGAAGGYCKPATREIVISDTAPPNASVRTLIHEIAHAHGITYTTHTRADAEMIVETVAFIVADTIGLDTSGEAIPYVASWAERGDVDAIKTHAETVDTIARTITDAIDPNPNTPDTKGHENV